MSDQMKVLELVREEVTKAVSAERERCAKIVESIKETRVPGLYRGCDFYVGEDADGWRPLSDVEKQMLRAIAAKIRSGE